MFNFAEYSSKYVFLLGECEKVDGINIQCCSTEAHLLKCFYDFYVLADCDVLSGFNIIDFDLPYILNRSLESVERFW